MKTYPSYVPQRKYVPKLEGTTEVKARFKT